MASPSPHFLAELVYGSYWVYPSPAGTEQARAAKSFILNIKRDRITGEGRLIELAVQELKRILPETPLTGLLDGRTILVPMPTHGLRSKHGVWPAVSLADEMVAKGLASNCLPCVERVTPIRKSAGSQQRPSPREHYDTMEVATLSLQNATNIVMVDDVVTRGSTFSGAAARLREVVPRASIRAFALARTGSMSRFADPVIGKICTMPDGKGVRRDP